MKTNLILWFYFKSQKDNLISIKNISNNLMEFYSLTMAPSSARLPCRLLLLQGPLARLQVYLSLNRNGVPPVPKPNRLSNRDVITVDSQGIIHKMYQCTSRNAKILPSPMMREKPGFLRGLDTLYRWCPVSNQPILLLNPFVLRYLIRIWWLKWLRWAIWLSNLNCSRCSWNLLLSPLWTICPYVIPW